VDASDILLMIFSGFLGFGIPILFWIGTLVFGIVMLRRGGARPERFFIAGSALNILATILRIPVLYLPIWLHVRDYDADTMESINFGTGLFINIIFALGVMCLLYAFWLKFNRNRTEQAVSVETES
jgi:ABC-type Fe3+-siderophore transport system permease subunit